MFVGHFALALGAKRASPKVSLGTLVLSVQFLDLLWPVLLLLGMEHVRIVPGITAVTPLDFYDYPISHSLLTSIVWGIAFAAVYFFVSKNRTGAFIVGAGVLSHWVLDFITHRPDLPLIPGVDAYVGLGLWNSVAGSFIVEGALYLAGVCLYALGTEAEDTIGKVSFWIFAIVLPVFWIAGSFGTPPDPTRLAIGGLVMWLFVPWAYWIDRHRRVKSPAASQGSTQS